ncbi:MAG: methylthioribulose-1-phosphate dehydratase [Halothiobacillaceae bacterium]|nr:MAG: methylthioribulose-1-phosphate dehydratase [Halothiobacillaceae bacterium]
MWLKLLLAAAAGQFYQRGWMFGTAGNLSARVDPYPHQKESSFWITTSGVPKGTLDEGDFLEISCQSGHLLREHPHHRPSAETSIHQVIYRLFPAATCCMHIHSINSALATQKLAAESNSLPLPPLEMIKGFQIWEENPEITLPVFENHLNVPLIAQEIERRFTLHTPIVPALMIRRHGITVWGSSIQETFNRVELMEFILGYLAHSSP